MMLSSALKMALLAAVSSSQGVLGNLSMTKVTTVLIVRTLSLLVVLASLLMLLPCRIPSALRSTPRCAAAVVNASPLSRCLRLGNVQVGGFSSLNDDPLEIIVAGKEKVRPPPGCELAVKYESRVPLVLPNENQPNISAGRSRKGMRTRATCMRVPVCSLGLHV